MKTSLLTLLALGLTTFAAQAQWVNQPITAGSPFLLVNQIDAVDANAAWGSGVDLLAENTSLMRTANGSNWAITNITGVGAGEYITSVTAVSASTAWVTIYQDNTGGGRIMKTTDGGATWTQVTTTQFASTNSYPDLVHFFNANDGVAVGDPDGVTPGFEIYTTTNGGTSWTRATNVPAELTGEWGATTELLAPVFNTSGDNIWFCTDEGRVYHSTNKGQTWTVGDTGLGEGPAAIAFVNATTGLVLTSAHALKRTTDGGATWTNLAYTGPLRGVAIDNIPGGTGLLSVGVDGSDAGSSYSFDNGATWTNLENTYAHVSLDVASPTVAWTGGVDPSGAASSGLNKLNTSVLGTRRDAALQQALSVYPNPSHDGVFTLNLAKNLPQATEVRVTDALGREVYRHSLSATDARTNTSTLDLRQHKAGLYTLELRSASGVAQQKLVIQ